MNEKQKKQPKEPLHIPLDFEQTLADMLKIKPPPDREAAKDKAKKKDAPKKKAD